MLSALLPLFFGLFFLGLPARGGAEDTEDGPDPLTDDDDRFAGTPGQDAFDGGGGDDILIGGAGQDALAGGPGDDLIHGGEGDDWLSGGPGSDRIHGDAGDDRIDATDPADSGADTVDGGTGDDRLTGDDGDLLIGGAGHDAFVGMDGPGADPVRIADLAPDETVLIQTDHPDPGPALLRVAGNGADTEVLVAGRVVALIAGRTDLTGAEIALVRLTDAA